MKIVEQMERLIDAFDSQDEAQKELTVFEAGNIWEILTLRYDIAEGTQLLNSFVHDPDFKAILDAGQKTLRKQINELEDLMAHYGLPMPPRPPAASQSMLKVEEIHDRWIFGVLFAGIRNFLFRHTEAYVRTNSPKLRQLFLRFLNDEAKIYDRFHMYGQLKGWLTKPPAYRV